MATATETPAKETPRKEAVRAPKNRRSTIKSTTEFSEQVLEQIQTGQRGAIAAVREFVDSADNALPSLGDGSSRSQGVIDSALEMSEQLVQIQYDFIRNVVRSASEALGEPRRTE